jgi:phosphatidate phosphatase APP1
MKTIRNVFFTTITMIGLSAAAQAGWSWHTGWSGSNCNTTTEKQTDSEHYSAWGDRCYTRDTQRSRHTRTSRGNWCDTTRDNEHTNSHNWGNWCGHCGEEEDSHNNGSKCHRKKGRIKGIVFEDTNNNSQFDRCTDKRLQNVTVKITDSNGNTYQVTTNRNGFFFAKHIAIGKAIVDIDETTLPAGSSIVVGNEPDTIYVTSRRRPSINYYGYTLGDPTGTVVGQIFEDHNENGILDNNEVGIAGITVTLVDANGETHTTVTNCEGKYTFSNIIEGPATVMIDPASLPDNAELTIGDNPSDINVIANEENDAGIDGYVVSMQTFGSVTGFIFEDRDSNGEFDSYDLPISGITVSIKTSTNEEFNVTTGTDGYYTVDNIPSGNATVTVNTDDILTEYPNMVQTAGDNPTAITVFANKTADAGSDSYNFMNGALITGRLYKDENEDGTFTEGTDIPMENITVSHENVPESRGDTITTVETTTDSNGVWHVYMTFPENTDIKVTVNETDIQDNYGDLIISDGDNPSYIQLSYGTMNIISNIGYQVDSDTDDGK